MATIIPYRLGDTRPLILAPRDAAGDLAVGRVELRIAAGDSCITVPCTRAADGYAADLAALGLEQRRYAASVWLDRTGREHVADIVLHIKGGC